MPKGPQTPAGLLSFGSKTPVKVFRKFLALALAAAHLFVSVPAHAADPRKMLKMSRDYFGAIAAERDVRRPAEQFANAEASKLALIEQKNMVAALADAQGTKDKSNNGKGNGNDPVPIPPDLSEHADYDSVRNYPVSVGPRPEIQGDAFSAILASGFSVQKQEHAFVLALENFAKGLFRGAAQQLFGYVTSAYFTGTFGAASSFGLIGGAASSYISAKIAQYTSMYELSSKAEQYFRSAASYLKQNESGGDSLFDNFGPRSLIEAIAQISTVQTLVSAGATVGDYIAEKNAGGPYYPYDYGTYAKIRARNYVSSLPSIYAADAAFRGDTAFSYAPYVGLFDTFQAQSNETYMQSASSGTQLAASAAQTFSAGFERYHRSERTSEDKSLYKKALSTYGAALESIADLFRAARNEIDTFFVSEGFQTSAGDGVFRFNINESRSVFTDPQGNTYADTMAGEIVSFDLVDGPSSLLQVILKDRKFWTEKQGSKFVAIDNNRADYSALSKTYPSLAAVRVVETGKDTQWELRDAVSNDLVMKIGVAGSKDLAENQNPMSLGNAQVRERYENGKLIRMDVMSLDDFSSYIVKKRDDLDAILYDPITGWFRDAIISDVYLDNEDYGFRIFIHDGYVENVEIVNLTLLGTIDKVLGSRRGLLGYPYTYGDLSKLEHILDKKQYPNVDMTQFRNGIDQLKIFAPKALQKGELAFSDNTTTVSTEDNEWKVRSRAGFYFEDDPQEYVFKKDDYTSSTLQVGPFRTQNGIPLTAISGQVSREETLYRGGVITGIPQEYGIYGSASGEVQALQASADVKAGLFSTANQAYMGNKDRYANKSFVEIDSAGDIWVGSTWRYLNHHGEFLEGEFKSRFIESEDRASRVTDGYVNHLLGNLILGGLAGVETKALSEFYLSMIQNYLVSQAIKSFNALVGVADSGFKSIINDFQDKMQPMLNNIYHEHLHLISAVSKETQSDSRNNLALQTLFNNVTRPADNLTQFSTTFASNYVQKLLSPII